MNPLRSMMNPQQMLMNMLSQKNPQAYQQFRMLMNSGQNPQMLLSQMMSGLNSNQKAQLEQMAKQFGLH